VDRDEIDNVDNDGRRLAEGLLFLGLYCLAIPASIYLSWNVGIDCGEISPCKLPAAPGVWSTSGAFVIGAIFVLRNFVQRRIGAGVSICAVVMGAALGGSFVSPPLIVASMSALLASGFVGLIVYTPIARKHFVWAVVASSLASASVDSAVFLWLGFNSLELLPGQVLAKVWFILIAIPFTVWILKRDRRIGLAPA